MIRGLLTITYELTKQSYRSDSIGSFRAALIAGIVPKITPTDIATPAETNTIGQVMTGVKLVVTRMIKLTANDRITPKIPPTTLKVTASEKN